MARALQREGYQVAAQSSRDEEDSVCCHTEKNPHTAGIHEFFRKLRERWGMYDSIEADARDRTDTEDDSILGSSQRYGIFHRSMSTPPTKSNRIPHSPLRTASSFDGSREYPTILPEEVVLPGSKLQHQMAKAMKQYSIHESVDECVICMEGFDPTNPRMPTLCGCGENKTYFHLPCLYQWIEQSPDCPSCRQRLRWEEF